MCMLICICMLTKRTNILFEEKTWKELSKIAENQNTSIGKLVRSAVEEKYLHDSDLQRRREAFDRIIKMKEDYKRKNPHPKKKESVISMVRRMRKEREEHIWKVLQDYRTNK